MSLNTADVQESTRNCYLNSRFVWSLKNPPMSYITHSHLWSSVMQFNEKEIIMIIRWAAGGANLCTTQSMMKINGTLNKIIVRFTYGFTTLYNSLSKQGLGPWVLNCEPMVSNRRPSTPHILGIRTLLWRHLSVRYSLHGRHRQHLVEDVSAAPPPRRSLSHRLHPHHV